MAIRTLYMDNATTTQVDERVAEAMRPYLTTHYGDPSSIHSLGADAAKALKHARKIIASAMGAHDKEIVFTSGGTESNNLAIKGVAWAHGKGHIITTEIEHESVLATCKWLETQGFTITYLKVDTEGFVDIEEVRQAIRGDTILVSVLHASAEIGTVQNIGAIGRLCKEHRITFHTDASQSFTKEHIPIEDVDLLTTQAHLIHGPKGIGALFIKKGTEIAPLLHGGGQEKGLRAGSEDIASIIGFAKAVKISREKDVRLMTSLRDLMIAELLKLNGTKLNGPASEYRLCNNINVFFLGIDAHALVKHLDGKNIYVSTSRKDVLKAIGLSESAAKSTLRISIDRETTRGDVIRVVETISTYVKKRQDDDVFDKMDT